MFSLFGARDVIGPKSSTINIISSSVNFYISVCHVCGMAQVAKAYSQGHTFDETVYKKRDNTCGKMSNCLQELIQQQRHFRKWLARDSSHKREAH